MTQAVAALGTQLLKENPAGSGTYVSVAEVHKLKGPTEALETIDVTNLDSNGTKEFIQGLHDGGDVSFSVNYNTGHEVLRVFGPPVNWKLQLPAIGTPAVTMGHLSFSGSVTKFDRDFEETKQLLVNVTIKISGIVTFVAGS